MARKIPSERDFVLLRLYQHWICRRRDRLYYLRENGTRKQKKYGPSARKSWFANCVPLVAAVGSKVLQEL